MTTKQLRRHVRKIRFSWFMVFFLLVFAVACFYCAHQATEACYATWIEPEGDDKTQLESLERAIALHPAETEGYGKILDIYLKDGLLTKEENAQFQTLLQKHQERLNKELEKFAPLYHRLALGYISCYDADAATRLKMAYSYLEMVEPYQTEEADITTIHVYLELEAYYGEYIWLEGTLREPNAAEVNDMMRRMAAMFDTFQKGSDRDRLAFACCLAALMDEHGQLWIEKVGTAKVAEFAYKIEQQSVAEVSDPAAVRLRAELTAWKNETKPWEVG